VGTLPALVLLAGAHEHQADTATTVLAEHYEPVHLPCSPSQAAIQCTSAAGVDDEQAPGHLGEQPVDTIRPGRLQQDRTGALDMLMVLEPCHVVSS
jgi:hypothetical protein